MLSTTERFGSYLESIGLAEASTHVRALSEQMIPAFATETCAGGVAWHAVVSAV